MTHKDLKNQFAYLALRCDAVKRMPVYMQAAAIPELLALQLALFGSLIDAIETLETLQKETSR